MNIKKRVNKSKEDLKVQMAHTQKVEAQKKLARLIFPVIASMKTIYDAQTVVNALAGFIKADQAAQVAAMKVKDLTIDLSKEKASEIKAAILALREVFFYENASDAAALLERFGNGLGQFSANAYMKNPMSDIKMEDFIA